MLIESMNATARDPLRSYFHEPQKNEIHLLYLHFDFTCFFFLFFYLRNFDLNLAKKAAKKRCNPTWLVSTFNSRHYDMTSIERYVGQSTIAFIYDAA